MYRTAAAAVVPIGGEGDVRRLDLSRLKRSVLPKPALRSSRTEALHRRLFDNALAALELFTIYLGERLGLYRALAEGGRPPRRGSAREH